MFDAKEMSLGSKVRVASRLGEVKGRLADLTPIERGGVVFALTAQALVDHRALAIEAGCLEEWRAVTRRIVEVFGIILEVDDDRRISDAVSAILFPGGRRDDPTVAPAPTEIM